MATPDYTKKISELRTKVGQYTELPIQNSITTYNLQKIIYSPIFFYSIPPIISILILLIIKPSFVYTNEINKDKNPTQKLSFTTVLITGLIVGAVISAGLFVFFRKNNI
jgi:hypothetical protein